MAQINQWFGKLSGWLIFIMMLLTIGTVVLRYGFGIGSIALQEAAKYCHASAFLLACAFTLRSNDHVRVDIFYARMNDEQKAWLNVFGTIALLYPFALFLLYAGWHFFWAAWQIGESSSEAGGLAFVYLVKLVIPASMLLLLIEATLLLKQSVCELIYPQTQREQSQASSQAEAKL